MDGEGNDDMARAMRSMEMLRKLSDGMDGFLGSSSQAMRLKMIMQGIMDVGNDIRQLESLNELCQVLCMSNEENLMGVNMDELVNVLVQTLYLEHNPDLMLLASRAITQLVEVMPSAGGAIVQSGALSWFCAKLLTIEYIDLAEQSLQALEKLSHEHSRAILRAGGLLAMLSFLDFFSTGVQRVALKTVANLCRRVPHECHDMVSQAVPVLSNLLGYGDTQLVESTCVSFARLVNSFAHKKDSLNMLTSHGMLEKIVHVIDTPSPKISPATFTGIVRMLAVLAQGSDDIAVTLLGSNIVHVVERILKGAPPTSDSDSDEAAAVEAAAAASHAAATGGGLSHIMNRPHEQMSALLFLVDELLPLLPPSVSFSDVSSAHGTSTPGKPAAPSFSLSGDGEGEEGSDAEPDGKREYITAHPEAVTTFAHALIPSLMEICGTTVNIDVRHKALSAISKCVFFMTSGAVKEEFRHLGVSSFVARLLASADLSIVATALQMCENLMESLPTVFQDAFLREGVIAAVYRVATEGDAKPAASPVPAATRAAAKASTPTAAAGASSPLAGSQLAVNEPPSSPMTPATSSRASHLRVAIRARAGHFVDKYCDASMRDANGNYCSARMHHLSAIATRLADMPPDGSDAGVLDELAALLTGDSAVSTFEFLGSGIVPALLERLVGLDGALPDATARARRAHVLRQFVRVFGGAAAAGEPAGSPHALAALVRKLHSALEATERFPVILHETSGSSFSGGLRALTQPFKLRLKRGHAPVGIRDYSGNVVHIEPLATAGAIRTFLLGKVTAAAPRRRTFGLFGRRRMSDEDEEDEEELDSEDELELEGALEVEEEEDIEVEDDDAMEEEEEEEEEEGAATGKKGKKSKSTGSKEKEKKEKEKKKKKKKKAEKKSPPKQEKLGKKSKNKSKGASSAAAASSSSSSPSPATAKRDAEMEDADSSGSSSGSSPEHGGARKNKSKKNKHASCESHNSAKKQRKSSAGAGKRMERRAPLKPDDLELTLRLGATVIDPNTTIFQAIQRGYVPPPGEESTPRSARKLWGDVYTVYYDVTVKDKAKDTAPAAASASSPAPASSPALQEGDASTSSPSSGKVVVLPVASVPMDADLVRALPCGIAPTHPTHDILALLRVLHSVSTWWPHVVHGAVVPRTVVRSPLLPPHAFVNNKLTAKLNRQLQDPLALCSGALAAWCKELTATCAFLFPFESRRTYFLSTSFGISRALQLLQRNTEQETDQQEQYRLGRLQRQKVKLRRNRILASAERVMELSAKQRAILEVEYFGEVGTGLGPTMEFFTLVSHELLRKDLGMWRESSATQPSEERATTTTTAAATTMAGDVDMYDADGDAEATRLHMDSVSSSARIEPVTPDTQVTIKGFHRCAVLLCGNEACRNLEFALDDKQTSLLCMRQDDGHGTSVDGKWSTRDRPQCTLCGGANEVKWWALCDEEAEYLESVFPPDAEHVDHMALQCPTCKSINFPGTENSLLLARNGRMESASGTVMNEEDYRLVTRHLSSVCDNAALSELPVRLTPLQAHMLHPLVHATPEVRDDGSLAGEEDDVPREYVHAVGGLFPCALAQHSDGDGDVEMADGGGVGGVGAVGDADARNQSVLRRFKFLGRFVAKALQDNRILDLPFSVPWYHIMLGRAVSVYDVRHLDEQLGRSLERMLELVEQRLAIERDASLDAAAKAARIAALTLDGASVDMLCLNFTLPGRPDVELVRGGTDVDVTMGNLEAYLQAVVDHVLHVDVCAQVAAFRAGFDEVFPLHTLRLFSVPELERMLCGVAEAWTVDFLMKHTKRDHGYNDDSQAVRFLFEIMSGLSTDEKRLFLRFVTGSPSLPVGGLRGLQPRLTIVRKAIDGAPADSFFPSVMTCQNYLKLPDYSSKEIMRAKLMHAAREGVHFHMS